MSAERPTLIAQISDLHIKPPGALAYGRVDTAAALRALVATLNELSPRPDLVVATGDLVDGGTEIEYRHLLELLRPLELPLAVTCGNHDDRGEARSAFADQPFAARAAALNQRRRIGPLDVLLLDSSVPGVPHGELDADTLAWLDASLAESRRPTLVLLHHPPFASGIWHMDRQPLTNAEALESVIRRHSHVRLVGCGHVHRSMTTTFAGTVGTICPAPNHAVSLDLDRRLPPSFHIEPPAFHLHVWWPSAGTLLTHTVPIGTFAGPLPFYDAAGKLI